MFIIRMSCDGVPQSFGAQGSVCITEEFAQRTWHTSALCTWNGSSLVLEVENDFDENGSATQDEFSDLISGCIQPGFDGDITIESISAF